MEVFPAAWGLTWFTGSRDLSGPFGLGVECAGTGLAWPQKLGSNELVAQSNATSELGCRGVFSTEPAEMFPAALGCARKLDSRDVLNPEPPEVFLAALGCARILGARCVLSPEPVEMFLAALGCARSAAK